MADGKRRTLRLTERRRREIFDKTGGHCHICGDPLVFEKRGKFHGLEQGAWDADHVFQFARPGAEDKMENLLPACTECNGLKWFNSGREFRYLLRVGYVGVRAIKGNSALGKQLQKEYEAQEKRKAARRVRKAEPSNG